MRTRNGEKFTLFNKILLKMHKLTLVYYYHDNI